MVRVDLERVWVGFLGVADSLEECSPPECLEVLGKVVGRHEGADMSAQGFGGAVMERLGGCVRDSSVHAFGLAIGPGVVGFGKPVLDGVLVAHAVERVPHAARWCCVD